MLKGLVSAINYYHFFAFIYSQPISFISTTAENLCLICSFLRINGLFTIGLGEIKQDRKSVWYILLS